MIDLEAIKERQKNFACFCADSFAYSNPQHHPECMSSDINTDVRDLLAEVERLRAVVEYYADTNNWFENSEDADSRISNADCEIVRFADNYSEYLGGKRAREALGDE